MNKGAPQPVGVHEFNVGVLFRELHNVNLGIQRITIVGIFFREGDDDSMSVRCQVFAHLSAEHGSPRRLLKIGYRMKDQNAAEPKKTTHCAKIARRRDSQRGAMRCQLSWYGVGGPSLEKIANRIT